MKKVLFNLTEEQHSRLEQLAKRMGVSKSEALRRAVEIYQIIKDAQAEGAEIRKRSKNGEEIVVQIIG
jgi:predicted DNA-binding protein